VRLNTTIQSNHAPYHAVNLAFIALILLIFTYSLIFKEDNHPIPALLTLATGEIPPSKGLSASFSEIVRGNFDEALSHNPHAIRVFLFFAAQLFLRIGTSMALLFLSIPRLGRLALIDSAVSIALFSWCFAPLIAYTFSITLRLL
jgi:hypothetical protein